MAVSSTRCPTPPPSGCSSGWRSSRPPDGGPDMLRLSVRSLLAHKLRMLMSVAAVVLGVAFVAGTLVFTNSRSSALDDVIAGGATDVSVTPKSAVDGSAPATGAVLTGPDTPRARAGRVPAPGAVLTVPDKTRPRIGSLPGVSRADGSVTVPGVFVLGSDGK